MGDSPSHLDDLLQDIDPMFPGKIFSKKPSLLLI